MMLFLTLHKDTPEYHSKFDELYNKYKNFAVRFACRILHDPYAAEDAVHEAFERIWKNLGSVDDVDSFRTRSFIKTIVYNEARREYVKLYGKHNLVSYEESYMLTEHSSGDLVWDAFTTKLNWEELAAALRMLSDRDRGLLINRYIHGCPHDVLARLYRMTPQSSRVALNRALKKAAKIIRENRNRSEARPDEQKKQPAISGEMEGRQ